MLTTLTLWLIPMVTAIASKRGAPTHIWRNSGIALGLVVAPASLGLYELYFVGPLLAPLSMLGFLMALIHGTPGYKLSIALGVIQPSTIVTGLAYVPVELLNAVVWSLVYGTLGALTDGRRARRRIGTHHAI